MTKRELAWVILGVALLSTMGVIYEYFVWRFIRANPAIVQRASELAEQESRKARELMAGRAVDELPKVIISRPGSDKASAAKSSPKRRSAVIGRKTPRAPQQEQREIRINIP